MGRPLGAIGPGHARLHRHGVLGAEVENLPDLDAAGMQPLVGRHFPLEPGGIVHIGGRRVHAGPGLDQRGEITVIIDVLPRDR